MSKNRPKSNHHRSSRYHQRSKTLRKSSTHRRRNTYQKSNPYQRCNAHRRGSTRRRHSSRRNVLFANNLRLDKSLCRIRLLQNFQNLLLCRFSFLYLREIVYGLTSQLFLTAFVTLLSPHKEPSKLFYFGTKFCDVTIIYFNPATVTSNVLF